MKALMSLIKLVAFFGLVFAAIVGVLYYAFWERTFIPHNGMAPTLFEGDEVLYWRGSENIRRGEIVICEHPRDGGLVVGRVIAMAGDRLEQDRTSIRLNGKSITSRSDIKGKVMFSSDGRREREHVWAKRDFFSKNHLFFRSQGSEPAVNQDKIKPGNLYLMGDNMPLYRHDSRKFGLVKEATCLGEVFMRLNRGNTPPEGIPYGDLDLIE